jgi:anti-sigma28 factor (negative regulator of flagellin synthesis)
LGVGKRKVGGKSTARGTAGGRTERARPSRKAGRKPGAHKMRAERIRKEIENGTYETEGKLRIAISRLIDDVLPRGSKSKD